MARRYGVGMCGGDVWCGCVVWMCGCVVCGCGVGVVWRCGVGICVVDVWL